MFIDLKCGYTYKQVKYKDWVDYDPYFMDHLNFAYNNNDRLSSNYVIKAIDRMQEYGYVFNSDQRDLVYMVGLEDFGNGYFRSESRLFVHPTYRRRIWRSPDNYETVKRQIFNHREDTRFLFKSREGASPGGFLISQRLDNYFNDWYVYPTKIELKYKDNIQWIMYHGEHENIHEKIKPILY